MNVNPKIEQWKDEVIGSLAGIQRAEPQAFLFTRIEAKLTKGIGVSPMQVRLATVGFIILVLVNVYALTKMKDSSTINTDYSLTSLQSY
jgi:hypothetical protein